MGPWTPRTKTKRSVTIGEPVIAIAILVHTSTENYRILLLPTVLTHQSGVTVVLTMTILLPPLRSRAHATTGPITPPPLGAAPTIPETSQPGSPPRGFPRFVNFGSKGAVATAMAVDTCILGAKGIAFPW